MHDDFTNIFSTGSKTRKKATKERDAKTTKPLMLQGTVPKLRSVFLLRSVAQQFSFNMSFEGETCSCWHEDGKMHLECPKEVKDEFSMLLDEVEHLGERVNTLDDLEVAEFLYKYFKMKRRLIRSLRNVLPFSKRTMYQVTYGDKISAPATQ